MGNIVLLSAVRDAGDGTLDRHRLDVIPEASTPRDDRGASRTTHLGLAAALALHGAALLLLHGFGAPAPLGGSGQYLEAISVSIVPSAVLETVDKTLSDSHGGAGAADTLRADSAPQPKAPIPEPVTREQPDQSQLQPQQEIKPQPVPEAEKIETDKPPLKPPVQHEDVSATSRGLDQAPSTAAAGASPGEINRYAMAVRAALARSRPRNIHAAGTVTILFVIDEDGGIRSATLAQSSGQRHIDEAALTSVRQTRFPKPPADMTTEQRTYVIPFHFK